MEDCSICGFHGIFLPGGWPVRPQSTCPGCRSRERHRLVKLWGDENHSLLKNKKILHFAPERSVRSFIKPYASEYVTADIRPGAADLVLNIELIDLPAASFDIAICVHVLEHVDDKAALRELRRILRPGGLLLAMFPIIEGWKTYENPQIVSPRDRKLHFGQHNHVRYFGYDVRERIRAAGFALEEFTAVEPFVSRHGLIRGEKVFLATAV